MKLVLYLYNNRIWHHCNTQLTLQYKASYRNFDNEHFICETCKRLFPKFIFIGNIKYEKDIHRSFVRLNVPKETEFTIDY